MQYTLIPQKPYCCVPAALSMILVRRGFTPPPQEEIAYDLGVVLPVDQKHLLPKSHDDPPSRAGYGTRIHFPQYSLTAFFEKHNLPLQEKYVDAKGFVSVDDLRVFVQDTLSRGVDMLSCFDEARITGGVSPRGHCALIASYQNGKVVLADGSRGGRVRKIALTTFYSALHNHFMGGIWNIDSLPEQH